MKPSTEKQYCKVAKTYKKACKSDVLCDPKDEFDTLQKCGICAKTQ